MNQFSKVFYSLQKTKPDLKSKTRFVYIQGVFTKGKVYNLWYKNNVEKTFCITECNPKKRICELPTQFKFSNTCLQKLLKTLRENRHHQNFEEQQEPNFMFPTKKGQQKMERKNNKLFLQNSKNFQLKVQCLISTTD